MNERWQFSAEVWEKIKDSDLDCALREGRDLLDSIEESYLALGALGRQFLSALLVSIAALVGWLISSSGNKYSPFALALLIVATGAALLILKMCVSLRDWYGHGFEPRQLLTFDRVSSDESGFRASLVFGLQQKIDEDMATVRQRARWIEWITWSTIISVLVVVVAAVVVEGFPSG